MHTNLEVSLQESSLLRHHIGPCNALQGSHCKAEYCTHESQQMFSRPSCMLFRSRSRAASCSSRPATFSDADAITSADSSKYLLALCHLREAIPKVIPQRLLYFLIMNYIQMSKLT